MMTNKVYKWVNPILFNYRLLFICSVINFSSVDVLAVNSGTPMNQLHPNNRVSNVTEQPNDNIKHSKFKKRIQSLIQILQKKNSKEPVNIPNAAFFSFGLGLAGVIGVLISSLTVGVTFLIGLLMGLIAIPFGIIALVQIKRSNGKLKGRSLAFWGIILGILPIAWITYVLFIVGIA